MFDTAELKERTDLIAFVEGDTTLHRASATEWAGPCPKCGGEDRFHVTGTWWFCRQCHEDRGDCIEYVRWRDGVGFAEACEVLGGKDDGRPKQRRDPRPAPRPTVAAPIVTPSDAWQERARAFVDYAQGQLWGNPEALAYLRDRGLAESTIKAAGLGYNPKELFDRDLARWGVTDGKAIWIPAGWVIPCEAGGALQYVKVRRTSGDVPRCEAWNAAHPDRRPKPTHKYHTIKGGEKMGAVYGLDGIGGHADLILCEGEINALILGQELAGAAAVVSVGDAGNMPSIEALGEMVMVWRWWVVFDPDEAGSKGRAKLAEAYGRAWPMVWPYDGDLNDAHIAGENLAAWAVPQIGPRDPDKRREWLEWHLKRLGDLAFEHCCPSPGREDDDRTGPAWRVWLAMDKEREACLVTR